MKLNKNKKGGIEGLPLQLMIVIIIATMGTAILVGWMGNIDTPQSIGQVQVLSEDIILDGYHTNDGTIEICVIDQDGNPLEGATVVLSGLGVKCNGNRPVGYTDENGNIVFKDLSITMRGSYIGYISINVSMNNYGENNNARVTVIA
jgi:hypothetical protein